MAKKGGKKKKKVVDPAELERMKQEEAEEKKRKAMQLQAWELRKRCQQEDDALHHVYLERDKISYFWIIERKTLGEKQADLRNKKRECQDLEERQQIELKMFQQRLKHLRYHQQDEVVELKTEAELSLKLQEDHHRVTEAEIKKDKRALKVEKKEQEVAQDDFVRMLRLENDQRILELRQEFDRRARDMQQKYELRMKTIREEMERTQKKQTSKIEEAKNAHIDAVMKQNQKNFLEIKVYYKEITDSNLELIKMLKFELQSLKKEENLNAKKMYDAEMTNKRLKDPLKKAREAVEAMEVDLQAYDIKKKELADVKEKIKQSETLLKRLEFQHEVLQQQLRTLSAERDTLYNKFQQAIYEVHQRSGLKNLLLEKKIDTILEAMVTTEAQVAELQTSAGITDPEASGLSAYLDEVITTKNEMVAQLQEEVQRVQEAHRTMVRTYESKLAEYGIPPEELGFTPQIHSQGNFTNP